MGIGSKWETYDVGADRAVHWTRVRRGAAWASADVRIAKALGALVAIVALAVAAAVPASAEQRVDLNRATASELASLPGVGEAKAQAIIAYREATPFASVDDLLRVKGIGDKLLEQLRDRVEVTAATGARATSGGGGAVVSPDRGDSAPKAGHAAGRAGSSGGTRSRGEGGTGS